MTPKQIWLIGGVALYMLTMLAIGFWTSSKIKNTKDYIVAGGRLGWWLSIGSLFATWFGAETCMGSSRIAFEEGILGVIADPFGAGLCLILAGIFFARFFYHMNVTTLVDFFQVRYGMAVGRALSVLYIPVYLGWVGAQLLALGVILNVLTGMPQMVAIPISTVVVLIYTYAGGMWAVSVTDMVQMVILIAGFGLLFPILLADIGGFQAVRTKLPPEYFYFYPKENSLLVWLNYIQAWVIVGLGSLPGQDLFQRLMAPKNETIAKWGAVISGVMYIVVGLLPVYMGMIGKVLLPENPSDSILVDLAIKFLPLPLIAVMIGALLSAIMSTVSSALLAPASIIGNNIVSYFKSDADDALKLKWCRRSIPLVGICSLVLALYFQNIYTLCTQSWGILLVGVVAPMAAGVYWKRANTPGAVASAVLGTASWILFSIFLPEGYPVHLFGFFVSSAALIVVSLMTPKTAGAKRAYQFQS